MADLNETISQGDPGSQHISDHETLHAFHNRFALGTPNTGDVLTWDGTDFAPAAPASGSSGGQYAFASVLYVHPTAGNDVTNDGLTWDTAKATIGAAVASGARVIYLAPGTHQVTSPVVVGGQTGVAIIGPATAARRFDVDSATAIITNTSGTPIDCYFRFDENGGGNQNGGLIRNVLFRSGNQTGPVDYVTSAAIRAVNSNYLRIENCRMVNDGAAAANLFWDAPLALFETETSRVTTWAAMRGCFVGNAPLISMTNAGNGFFNGHQIVNNHAQGYYSPTVPAISVSGGTDGGRIHIIGNHIDGFGSAAAAAISLTNLTQAYIRDNTARFMASPFNAVNLTTCVQCSISWASGLTGDTGYVFLNGNRVDTISGFTWGQWLDPNTHNNFMLAGPPQAYL